MESRRVAGDPYRMTITETQAQSPLFPLLPSVQILFAAFCCASIRSGSGGAAIPTPIRRPADTGRCIWLNHFGPRRTTASTRTIAESPKALPDDHHRNSTPSPFVSFAAFCSNFLLFLMSSFDRSGSNGDPRTTTIAEHATRMYYPRCRCRCRLSRLGDGQSGSTCHSRRSAVRVPELRRHRFRP